MNLNDTTELNKRLVDLFSEYGITGFAAIGFDQNCSYTFSGCDNSNEKVAFKTEIAQSAHLELCKAFGSTLFSRKSFEYKPGET